MDTDIKLILKDLYKMDKELKKNKKEVERVVRELLQSKPDAQIDAQFMTSLKAELASRVPFESTAAKESIISRLSKIFVSKIGLGLVGATAVLILALPFVYYGFYGDDGTSLPKPTLLTTGTSTQGVAGLTVKQKLLAQNRMIKFSSYDEAETFIKNNQPSGDVYGYSSGRGGVMMESMDTAAPMNTSISKSAVGGEALSSSGSATQSNEFSTTNIQVVGVDEADIIKNDGQYMYAVVKKDLYIVKAYPAEKAEIVSKISFKDRPQNIYLNGNNLIVFGAEDYTTFYKTHSSIMKRNNFTFFKVFDISDRKNPKQIRDLNFEGFYKDSRMIGDYVYFVTLQYGYTYLENQPIIPRIMEDGKVLPTKCSVNKTGCVVPNIYYFDIPYNSFDYISVNAINVKDSKESVANDLYLTEGSGEIFVSPKNIYLTYTKYISENELSMEAYKEVVYPKLPKYQKELIDAIEKTGRKILSDYEKFSKVFGIYNSYMASLPNTDMDTMTALVNKKVKEKYKDISKELEKTVIHKVEIDKNKLTYKATGEVTGDVLNQFSMDENKDGYFRVATTKNRTWSRFEDTSNKSYNNLYILDKELKITGKIEDLAKDERIYSVRFMQDRAYMVTFKQVDPLFVIDVKDPKAPKVLGKLKIPGFSDYLHPYDDTTLIGVGKDTKITDQDRVITTGVKLSLFDVSVVAKPKEISNYTMGGRGSSSLASTDHKAFLFEKKKNLLVLPVYLTQDKGEGYSSFEFGGAYVFNVDKKDGFKLKGKVDHGESKLVAEKEIWSGHNSYDRNVKRSFYINDILFTFSDQYLKANKISDLSEVKSLELLKVKKGSRDDFDIVN